MRKIIFTVMLFVLFSLAWADYAVGETVDPGDNIGWTIEGPDGHPDVGLTDNMFDMIRKGKPVMIFFGEDW